MEYAHPMLDEHGLAEKHAQAKKQMEEAMGKPRVSVAQPYGPDNPPRLRKPGESVEQYRAAMGWSTKPPNAEVSGAGTASAGLPGYAGDNNGEAK